MSLIQVEDLVSYQLRVSYLGEVADGVGERLISLNDNFLNTAPFKAAGWRTNPALIKRTHSPPIPTATASEYFQAPPRFGLTLEDDAEEGGMLTGGGTETPGPGIATRRRRERRREREMEEDDSSDLSDESDEESDQRAAQQIRFAKMPLRNRSGSSPIQSSQLRQTAVVSPQRQAPGARRGSQSALETVKERARRDTVTSSEVSSDNEFDNSGYRKHKDAARAAARSAKLQARIAEEPAQHVDRIRSEPLAEEDEDDSDLSDGSSAFVESVDSASILADVENTVLPASPGQQLVGTPPKQLLRQSTVRKPPTQPQPSISLVLPPPRPMSTLRPMSMVKPRSLLGDALKAKNTKPTMPLEQFASLSGKGDPDPLNIRIYTPFSKNSSKPFEVPIRKNIQEADGSFRPVTVAELIGLSLWRYHEDKLEPPIPNDKLNVNWWTLRMVDGDEVDDDFPPLERKKAVNSFTMTNNRAGGRSRGNSKMYDDFGLVQASQESFEENQKLTPQFAQEEVVEAVEEAAMPKNIPPPAPLPTRRRPNPITNTTFRIETAHADRPAAPEPAPVPASRGQKKFLKIHIMSADVAPGQMLTLDVTTDTYLAEVLDMVCKKRQLDKNQHVLKLPVSGSVVFVDRAVSSIGNVTDLELHRRRFATDGPLTITGSPIGSSPKQHIWDNALAAQKKKKDKGAPHPLAREAMKLDEVGSSDVRLKKFVVWKKQTMRFVGNERLLTIDGEYVYIQPSSGGKPTRENGKTTSVHFSNILNSCTSRKHPASIKLYVFKDASVKRTDYDAKNAQEAAEIVAEIKKGFAPYNKD